jgi:hypothetical protein
VTALSSGGVGGETRLPFAVEEAALSGAPGELWAVASRPVAEAASVRLGAASRRAQAQLDGFKSRALRAAPRAASQPRWLYEIEWSQLHQSLEPTPAGDGQTLVLTDVHRSLQLLVRCVTSSDLADAALSSAPWRSIVLATSLSHSFKDLRVVEMCLRLIQAQAVQPTWPPVWILTSCTQPNADHTATRCLHAGLWGLVRAVRQELRSLPVWCIDLRGSALGSSELGSVLRSEQLSLPHGSVRGLQLSTSVEPEAAFADSSLHIPRLVAPYHAHLVSLGLDFSALLPRLQDHTEQAMRRLEMDRLTRGYAALEHLCQK